MRPILLKGHERPLTFLKYNRDGDLLFSCAKDHTPTVWYAHNGERLGTYRGHNGAVWCCDVSSKISFRVIDEFIRACIHANIQRGIDTCGERLRGERNVESGVCVTRV